MQAKIITLANNKGGVGKTAIAANLGAGLNRKGYKVLLVDIDGQANLTDCYLDSSAIEETIAGALKRGRALPIVQLREGLAIVPSDDTSSGLGDIENLYAKLWANLKEIRSQFDFILIDTPPNIERPTISALLCSDFLIVPLAAEAAALKGLIALSGLVEQINKEQNTELKLLAAVLNFYEGRKNLSKFIVETIEETYSGLLCSTAIRRNVAIAEAVVEQEDIFTYDSKSRGAIDFGKLTEEILERLKSVE